ncbi:hypothetical protein [Mycolicibacterium fortuitum]|uniref:hypothetical protein n=1 Tax=Mycolicibacterium fortuitum TaxID=1766 RepID=UPI00148F5CD9|nr:hypothetical protein [Mycolicibacterium fortuitum]
MTVPERPVSEQARVLADQLETITHSLPTYGAREPGLSLRSGAVLARMLERLATDNAALPERVERLAKQVEGLQ